MNRNGYKMDEFMKASLIFEPLPPPSHPLPIIAVSNIGICCAIVYIGLDYPGSR
jgi:hypothetical protein